MGTIPAPGQGKNMKTIYACILLLGASGFTAARPVVIEATTTIPNPDPVAYKSFGRMVATNGEYALVLGARDETNGDEIRHRDALLYRRVGGSWQFQRILQTSARGNEGYDYPSVLAMKGDLAVTELDGV